MKYSDLVVWQKAMDLVEEIYRLTATFSSDERFGLSSQLQLAAVSIPSNIAEGHGRKSTAVFLNHLSIGIGSLMEVETQIQIAGRLDFLSNTSEIGKMLNGLRNSLISKTQPDTDS